MNLTTHLGVAIATHGKYPWRLRLVVDTWHALGMHVSVIGPPQVLRDLPPSPLLQAIPGDTRPEFLGDAIQQVLEASPRPWVLLGACDIVPVAHTWCRNDLVLHEGGIQAVELRSELDQRWGDWAHFDGTSIWNQPVTERRRGTFIAGGAQIISAEARSTISYGGRRYHEGDDIRYCWDAVGAGLALRPAMPGGPVLLHLDRFPAHASDPERLGAPLAYGPPAADVRRVGDLWFRVRPNTWDSSILAEVVTQDTYELNLWEPASDNPLIVDVGGHIGGLSAWLGSAFPSGRVHAFEPADDNARLFRTNTFGLSNVQLHPCAVGAADGAVRLVRAAGPNTGGHQTSAPSSGEGAIWCRDIAGVFAELEVSQGRPVDLLKLDCEGAEWGILRRLAETQLLATCHHIVMEAHRTHGFDVRDSVRGVLGATHELRVHPTVDADLLRVVACRGRGGRHHERSTSVSNEQQVVGIVP